MQSASRVASTEDDFFKEFKETQMLTYFIQNHYSRMVVDEEVEEEPERTMIKPDFEAKWEIEKIRKERFKNLPKNVLIQNEQKKKITQHTKGSPTHLLVHRKGVFLY